MAAEHDAFREFSREPVRLGQGPDLIREAYEYRDARFDHHRLRVAEELARTVALDKSASWHVVMSLHLLAVTLSGQIAPMRTIALLAAPIDTLVNRVVSEGDREMVRFAALLVRTVSMAASKADNYVLAFAQINRAHELIRAAYARDEHPDRLTLEALQQVCLQESGQLARNAEVGLLELNQATRAELQRGELPARGLKPEILRRIRVLALASVNAAGTASRITAQLHTPGRELPAIAAGESESLAVANWVVTANIMFMRAILLLATVESAAGGNCGDRLDWVPPLYLQTVTTKGATFQKSHCMDLARVALHYSCMANGATPYRVCKLAGVRLANGVPGYLTDGKPLLDMARCSQELIAGGHDAGILDNIAFSQVHRVLQKRSSQRYEGWLQGHREARQTLIDRTGDLDVQLRLAATGPDALHYTSRMVERRSRYAWW